MTLPANDLFPKHDDNEHQAVRLLSDNDMEFVSGGGLSPTLLAYLLKSPIPVRPKFPPYWPIR